MELGLYLGFDLAISQSESKILTAQAEKDKVLYNDKNDKFLFLGLVLCCCCVLLFFLCHELSFPPASR